MEKHISKSSLEEMDSIKRLNLVNSISGYKSANLIGSKSADGFSNLSIVSSVVHLNSSPALLGFMQRPTIVPRHTYSNIKETEFFTVNQVHKNIVGAAHYTSAKFLREESEFEKCGLTEEYKDNFWAPFVAESQLKISMRYVEEYSIVASRTILVVASIEHIYLPREIIFEDGQIDLNRINTVCISGLNNYHETNQVASFPYARPGKIPKNHISSSAKV